MVDRLCKGTVGDLPGEAARRFGMREALVFEGRRWSHQSFAEDIDRVARGLIALGIKPGEHVSVWLTNRPEHLFLIYAIARIGATLVPLNTRYRSHDAAFTIRHSNASTLILADRAGPVDYLEMAREIFPDLDDPGKEVGRFAEFPDLRRVIVLGSDVPQTAMAWSDLLARAGEVPVAALEKRATAVDPDATFLIAYTSGTTGDPKGVTHTHGCRRALVDHADRLGLTSEDVVLGYLPLFHLYAISDCLFTSTLTGAKLVLVERFEPVACLRLIESERATILHGFDTHYRDLMQAQARERRNLSSLRLGTLVAGLSSTAPIARAVQTELCPTVSGWGMTECWAFATMSLPDSNEEQRCEASGIPMPGYEFRIVDPGTGQELPFDSPGEILVRGYMVTPGYYRQPNITREVVDSSGWLHTGDMGLMRADGHLRFLGRYKDILKIGGENASPAEVEAFLMGHPGVAQVAVVGCFDTRLSEVPVAFVVSQSDRSPPNESEVIAYCKGRIAGFKTPRRVIFLDALPMTPTGKVQKHKLREMAAELIVDAKEVPT